MNRRLYEMILQDRLRELIEENPKEAYYDLSGSPENDPDLYEIAMLGDPKHWPSQILACARMQMLLNRIDFQKGQSLCLEASELPSLATITSIL